MDGFEAINVVNWKEYSRSCSKKKRLMKIQTKKYLIRGLGTLAFLALLLISFLLNPALSYAHKTEYKAITIYHQAELRPDLLKLIDQSLATVKSSALYDEQFRSHLCLNDGSIYPTVVRKLLGEDVFTAFSNKVVFLGEDRIENNRFSLWDRSLKYTQFLTHGWVHNLQYQHHGFWQSNPLGGHPNWCWEGYAEYITLGQQYTLKDLINRYQAHQGDPYTWFSLDNGEGTIRQHVKYLIMTKYAFEVKKLDYRSFLSLEEDEERYFANILAEYEGN